MLPAAYFLFSDGMAPSRVDKSSMNDQMLMELLVTQINGRKKLQSEDGVFQDISAWVGVKNDEEGHFIEIDWSQKFLFDYVGDEEDEYYAAHPVGAGGSMDLRWLPPTLKKFKIDGMELFGEINAEDLPEELVHLSESQNNFTGAFSVQGLSENIEYVDISENEFRGKLEIIHLPRKMWYFDAHENKFDGTLDFSSLPDSMERLYLGSNSFSGDINLSNLPSGLMVFTLRQNRISQHRLVIGKKRGTFRRINLDWDKFGEVVDGEGKRF